MDSQLNKTHGLFQNRPLMKSNMNIMSSLRSTTHSHRRHIVDQSFKKYLSSGVAPEHQEYFDEAMRDLEDKLLMYQRVKSSNT